MLRLRFVAVDTETGLIQAGLLAPPLVCVSFAERVIGGVIRRELLDHLEGVERVRELLLDPTVVLIFHNGPYDLAVLGAADPSLMPLIFDTLAAGRIADTQIREQLIMIARGDMGFQSVKRGGDEDPDAEASDESEDGDDEGDDEDDSGESNAWKRIKKRYTLDALSWHYLRRRLDKADDGWRLRYIELLGIPIAQWPDRAVTYAIEDAVSTLEVFEHQAPMAPGESRRLEELVSPDERAQVCAAFALHLCAVRGLRTDAEALDELEQRLLKNQNALGLKLMRAGLLKQKREKGIVKLARNMKPIRALVMAEFERLKLPVPLTKKGIEFAAAGKPIDPAKHISTAKDTLEQAASFPYPEDVGADDRATWLAGFEVEHKDRKKHKGEMIAGLTLEAFELARTDPKVDGAAARALEPLVAFANTQKILGTYVRPMKLGICYPMNSRPNVLVETGRTSWGAMTLTVDGSET